MNKKIVTLILVILLSFCFLSVVVADNGTQTDDNSTDYDGAIDQDDDDDNNDTADKNKTDDKDKSTDKDKKDDKPKKTYILAKAKGDNIKFSDGFRGFILDYSKSPASSGDEFKHVSTSKASNSNALKLAIIECYRQNSTGHMAKIIADIVKTGSSSSKVGKVVAESHEKVGDHEVVKIDNDTEAVFDFEVLKSVSGNESNYFAYKVSFRSISYDDAINQTNNLTNLTNLTNATNATNITNATNATNATNITNMTPPIDNETNATFLDGLLKELYDYLMFLANALYDAWRPIIDTLMNYFMMFINALEELVSMFEDFMAEIQALLDALGKLIDMLDSIWKEFDGLLKYLAILLNGIQQLLNWIGSLLEFLAGLISALISLISSIISFIISLIQQLLGLLYELIDFIIGLFNQLMSLLQAIFDFLKSAGSFLINVIENAAIIIIAFVIITVGAFVYERIR